MSKEKVNHYEKHWQEYDEWYDACPAIYQFEIKALEKVMPSGSGLVKTFRLKMKLFIMS